MDRSRRLQDARMIVNLDKTRKLIAKPIRFAAAGELRREGSVFFVAADLPARPTLEAIFDSDCLAPAELFHFRFSDADAFLGAEELVRLIKKNFKGFVLGQFAALPSSALVERAYAAGIDLLDLPVSSLSGTGDGRARLETLAFATTVFPRWATVATLEGWAMAPEAALCTVDHLLERQVLPLAALTGDTIPVAPKTAVDLFEHLVRGWRRRRATFKPLLPLLACTTPLVPPQPRGMVAALFDKAEDTRLRTTSDLRRLLRVRQVAESFESAGL